MKQFSQSGASSTDPALTEQAGQQLKTPTGALDYDFVTVSPEDNDPIEELLERYGFQYILERVKQTVNSYPTLKNRADEIASEVYDKFWQKLLEGPVHNPPSYIKTMIRNKCIDYLRRRVVEIIPLVQSKDEGLDILESDLVIASSEGLRDPAEEFEYKAAREEIYRRVTDAIARLSRRQQQAAAWRLLREADDPQLLMELFHASHIDIPEVRPGDKAEEQLLNASYAHAKKALARSLGIDLSKFKFNEQSTYRRQYRDGSVVPVHHQLATHTETPQACAPLLSV
jgi:DNA-directed RNA polymerase specialized sigma24 family protein